RASAPPPPSTTFARRAITCRVLGRTCRRVAIRGANRSTSATPTPTRCVATSSTARCGGCGSSLRAALWWMRECHADGLRLDAVHALVDTTAIHILEELAAETDALAEELGRPLSLIAESDLNDPRLITPRDRGGYGMTAQWDDDIHHAIHSAVSGERQGYYADFGSL